MRLGEVPNLVSPNDLVKVPWYTQTVLVYGPQLRSDATKLKLFRRNGMSVLDHLHQHGRSASSEAVYILRENIGAEDVA
jgi:hypothetical protein